MTIERIEIDPAVMLGKPVSVELILRKLPRAEREGAARDYPHLSIEDIRAAVGYGAASVAQEEVVLFSDTPVAARSGNMNFEADENGAEVIRALHEADHDVLVVVEVASGTPDEPVMERAFERQARADHGDHDFGELVHAQVPQRASSCGGFTAERAGPSRRAWSRRWLSWARGCKMALRLFRPAPYAWAEGREADVPWWRRRFVDGTLRRVVQ